MGVDAVLFIRWSVFGKVTGNVFRTEDAGGMCDRTNKIQGFFAFGSE
jgi:hypothetical protein